MNKNVLLVLTVFLFLLPIVSFSNTTRQDKKSFQDAQVIFEMGLSLKGEAKVQLMLEAAELFQSIMEADKIENGYLYYNIGNAYYEAGLKGKALLNYKRAAQFLPGLEELNSNIQQVELDLKLNLTPRGWWQNFKKDLFFWHYIIDYHQRKIGFIIFFITYWIILCVLIYKKNIFLTMASVFMLFITICFGASYLVSFYQVNYQKEGIVIIQQTDTRKGPSNSYEHFYQQPLLEGVAFKLIDVQNSWWKIELESGDKFWIQKSAAELI